VPVDAEAIRMSVHVGTSSAFATRSPGTTTVRHTVGDEPVDDRDEDDEPLSERICFFQG